MANTTFLFEKLSLDESIPFDDRAPKYNKETEAAMQEVKDIMSGKVKAKSYASAEELFEELDKEC